MDLDITNCDCINALGLIAGILTSSSLLLQVIKTLHTRDTTSIALGMYISYNIGVILWLTYAAIVYQPVLLITNGFSLVLGMTMLILKIKYK